mmetsp:Transcript_27675/g.70485  ORF Transcript_27675/g.70485 Transcript_27675/m.70485 type:complete len:216 (-) Transcript_27675:1062-1709(-)
MESKGNTLPLRALNHISRVCSDVKVSCAFYRDVLGFYEVKRPSSFDFEGAWLFNYGIGIHLIRGNPLPRSTTIVPKSDHLSFQAEGGLDEMEARLTGMGLPFVKQQVTEGAVRVTQLFVHDPDNNMIELCNCELLPVVPLEPGAVLCPSCMAPSASPDQVASLLFDHHHHHPPAPASPLGSDDSDNTTSSLQQGLRRSCSTSVLATRSPATMLHV